MDIVLVLLIIIFLIFVGVGFTLKILWWVAVIALVVIVARWLSRR